MTVVVSPLIALMKDQIDFLRRSGIDAERLDSSLDAAEQQTAVAGAEHVPHVVHGPRREELFRPF